MTPKGELLHLAQGLAKRLRRHGLKRHLIEVYGFIQSMARVVRRNGDAEDAAAEVFVFFLTNIWKNVDRRRSGDHIARYIHTSVRRRLMRYADYERWQTGKAKKQRRSFATSPEMMALTDAGVCNPHYLNRLCQQETLKHLLYRLTKQEHAVLTRLLDGENILEIAQCLGKAPETIRRMRRRIQGKMRILLGE